MSKILKLKIRGGCIRVMNINANKNGGRDRVELISILENNGINFRASSSIVVICAYEHSNTETVLKILEQHYSLDVRG